MTKLLSRRSLLGYGLGSALLVACGGRGGASSDARRLTPTPAVDDGDDDDVVAVADGGVCAPATADNIEGPFYKAGAPDKATLVRASDPGDRLSLGGIVRSSDCSVLESVEVDLWHADHVGGYDNDGYTFRGKLRTAADGSWHVDTIIPGRYLNGRRYRPAHIHAKLRAPGHRALTTQLYFDGDPYNDGDPFIVSSLIMPLSRDGALTRATFDFVLEKA